MSLDTVDLKVIKDHVPSFTVGFQNSDFICDGTADNVDINTAINRVADLGGGIIHVRTGNYSISAPIKLKSNVTLRGEGRQTVISQINSGNFHMITSFDETNGHSDVSLESLTINGNKANQSSNVNGVHLVNCTNLKIHDLVVYDCKRQGINIDGSLTEMVWITNNVIYNSGETGINLLDEVERIVVDRNYCYDNGAANISLNGTGSYVTFSNNVCKNAGRATPTADNITGYNKANTHFTVINNQCYSGGNNGIHVGGNDLIVIGNQVENADVDGIQVRNHDESQQTNALVVGNSVNSVTRYGVFVKNVTNGVVSSNNINAAGNTGINMELLSDTGVLGNSVTGSLLNDGLRFHTSARNKIIGNTSKNNARYGIYLSDDGTTVAQLNQVIGNNLYDSQGTKTQLYGIVTANSADNNVIANNISRASDHLTGAMSLAGTSNQVRNNVGWVTEASGLGTIGNGKTIGTITHGLSVTPSQDDFAITPTNNLGSATMLWMGTAGATQFIVTVDTDPGTDATFAWRAQVL